MKGLRLGQKLMASYLFMAALLCVASLLGIYYSGQVGKRGIEVGERLAPLADAAMEIKLSSTKAHLIFEEIMGGDKGEQVSEVYKLLDEALWYCNAILQGGHNAEGTYVASSDPRVRKKIRTVVESLNKFIAAAHIRYKELDSGTAGAGTQADKEFDGEFERFVKAADDVEELIHANMDKGIADLRAINSRAQLMLIITMIAGILLAIVAGFALSRSITLPVNSVAELSKRIAAGDLRVVAKDDAHTDRGDEIGTLQVSFLAMRDNIREAMSSLQEGAADLSARSSQVSSTAKQYAVSANQQATAVAEVSTTIEEIRQTSKAAADNAQQVVSATEKAVENGQRGLDAIAEAVELTKGIGDRVEAIAHKILQLSEQNSQIGEIVESVNDLAEQSNLLAVNASIEAAKAGEQGRGFSVVASEVRSLAEQSRRATQQIRGILADIQKATESAVMATEEGVKRVEDGRRSMDSVRTVVEELAAVLDESSSRARQIAGASEQQASGIAQIAQAIGGVEAAGKDNLAGVRQLEEAAAGLSQLGQTMQTTTERYQLS